MARVPGITLIGLDVSMTRTGWAVLRVEVPAPSTKPAPVAFTQSVFLAGGVIRTAKGDAGEHTHATIDNLHRAGAIAQEVDNLFASWSPAVLCVEAMSWPRNAGSTSKMALAWGAVAAVQRRYNLTAACVAPQSLKKHLTGSRSASKDAVQQALVLTYPNAKGLLKALPEGDHEHVFDALGACASLIPSPEVATALRLARQLNLPTEAT